MYIAWFHLLLSPSILQNRNHFLKSGAKKRVCIISIRAKGKSISIFLRTKSEGLFSTLDVIITFEPRSEIYIKFLMKNIAMLSII
ncbi:hypothetical protein AMS62_16570 [Bacillus sp. FJAT-18019]|nr:hypothetical protein AMS62_16570 [Bacillus sp. FJAT-18019]